MNIKEIERQLLDIGFLHLLGKLCVFFSTDGYCILKSARDESFHIVAISGSWTEKKITSQTGPLFMLPISEEDVLRHSTNLLSWLEQKREDWQSRIVCVASKARRVYSKRFRFLSGFWFWSIKTDKKTIGRVSIHTHKSTPLRFVRH